MLDERHIAVRYDFAMQRRKEFREIQLLDSVAGTERAPGFIQSSRRRQMPGARRDRRDQNAHRAMLGNCRESPIRNERRSARTANLYQALHRTGTSPEGRHENSPAFQGWVRASGNPASPEETADFIPNVLPLSLNAMVPSHLSRPFGTCASSNQVPNLERLGYSRI